MAVTFVEENNSAGSTERRFNVKFFSVGKTNCLDSIDVRPLKVKDFKILPGDNGTTQDYMKKLIEVLQDCIVHPKSFQIKDLTHQDLIQLMIAHRINSTGTKYDVLIPCEKCSNEEVVYRFPYTIDLDKLAATELKYKEPIEIDGVKFRLPRIEVFLFEDYDEENHIDSMIRSALNITAKEFKEVDLKTYNVVKKFLEDENNNYGFKDTVDAICPKCKEVAKDIAIRFRKDFFVI